MQDKSKQNYVYGAFLVFVGAILFGGKAVLVKYNYAHFHIDKVSFLALRMLFSAPFYLVILFFLNKDQSQVPKLAGKEWLYMLFIGTVGYYMASFLDFWGLVYVTANLERLILFVYPTIVVVISALFLKKKITKIQYWALGITYLGVALAFVPDLQMGLQKNVAFGSLLIFLCSVTYALYVIGSGQMIPKIGSLRFTCYAMLISTVMVLLHYYFTVGRGLFDYPTEAYWLVAVMAVFTTVIPSFMTTEGIKYIGASNASIVSSIGPVATIVMAYYALDEVITMWQIVGTIVVLVGVLMISVKK